MLSIKNNLAELMEGKKIKKTPLYYMGGKTKAIKTICSLIPNDIDTLYSPFFGGGSLEVAISGINNIEVFGYDIYRPLVQFWKCLIGPWYEPESRNILLEEIKELKPVTRESYKELLKVIDRDIDMDTYDYQVAAAYFALNRSSFMAQIWAGISTNPKNNITDNLLKRIKEFDETNLSIEYEDFKVVLSIIQIYDDLELQDNVIRECRKRFVYADPPYYVSKGTNYYGKKGDVANSFDHEGLAESLKDLRTPWLLSYDNVPEVRELYKNYRQIPLQWVYANATGSYTPEEPKEILILSNDLPEIIEG